MDVSSAGLPGSVALLGTGPMGAPIARNIIAAGVPLTLWNRTARKAHASGVVKRANPTGMPARQPRRDLAPPAWRRRGRGET